MLLPSWPLRGSWLQGFCQQLVGEKPYRFPRRALCLASHAPWDSRFFGKFQADAEILFTGTGDSPWVRWGKGGTDYYQMQFLLFPLLQELDKIESIFAAS